MDQEEQLRLSDLKERDEFAKRLKDKDKEKTRSIVSKSESKVSLFVLFRHDLEIPFFI